MVVIVGVLAAVAVPVFLSQRAKGVDAGLKADLRSLAAAQEAWMADNPSQLGTTDMTALTNAGFRRSPGNILRVAINPTKRGYCLLAKNDGDTRSNEPGWAVWYDSLAGGLINGGRQTPWTSVEPSAGACGSSSLTFVTLT